MTTTKHHPPAASNADPLAHVARRALERGVLGWTIVLPMLLAVFAGRCLDRTLQTNVFFSGSLLMVGAAIGFWSAWRWMHARGS